MKMIKKIALFGGVAACILGITGCENSNDLRLASFSNITAAGSTDYAIRISFAEDERVDEKFYDVQLKATKAGQLVFWKEGEEKKTLTIDEDNAWRSLTTLIAVSEGKPNTEQFIKYSEALTQTYIFNSNQDNTLLFRVVVGEPEDNAQKTGKILTSTEEVSSVFMLKMNKVT